MTAAKKVNRVVHKFAEARLRDSRDKLETSSEQWAIRHVDALTKWEPGFEHAIGSMLKAWAAYADAHYRRYNSVIGEDHVLGPLWEQQGQSLIGLLNGESGRLDCGTLDGLIRQIGNDNGFSASESW